MSQRTPTPTPTPISTSTSVPVRSDVPILVVDNDQAIRECLRLLLEGEGYDVVETTTLTGALAHLREATHGHIVLLDWLIPGRGEALLYAREQEPAAGPLHLHCYIVLTAADLNRFTDEEQRLIAATCLAALAKPFEVADLLAVIERAATHLRVAR